MNLLLEIPDRTVEELPVSPDEMQREMRSALACGLFAMGEADSGAAAELAGMSRLAQPPISRLGAGETAALALAAATPEAVLLMDERRARRAASILELTATGVLSLLMWAKQAGHLDSLAQAIDELRAKDSFFIDSELLRQAPAAAGKNRKVNCKPTLVAQCLSSEDGERTHPSQNGTSPANPRAFPAICSASAWSVPISASSSSHWAATSRRSPVAAALAMLTAIHEDEIKPLPADPARSTTPAPSAFRCLVTASNPTP